MQLESSGDLLSRIYFLLIHPTEHLFFKLALTWQGR